MPNWLAFICYLLAALCFAGAAFRNDSRGDVPGTRREFNLVALGLLFVTLVPLWAAAEALD